MKKKLRNIKLYIRIETLEFVLALIFWSCIFLSIRWSSLKCISDLKFIEFVFVSNHETDSTMLNIVTGYVTGYLVYYFTTRRPNKNRREPIREWTNQTLMSIYNKSVYLLLIICKCTATEKDWKQVVKETDLECFNNMFYEILKTFDLKKEAYTLLIDKETRSALTWGEYLYHEYEGMQNQIKDIYLQYGIYLDNDLEKIIHEIEQCNYMENFMGRAINTSRELTGFEDGKVYFDECPIYLLYTKESNMAPIFGNNGSIVDNARALIDYVELLHQLYDYLKIRINDKSSAADCSIEKINKDNVGTFCQARL